MGNYVTIDEVREFKIGGCVAGLDNYSNAEITTEIALSEEIVENFTGDKFYVVSSVEYRFDGQGMTKLFFAPTTELRVLTISAVKEYDLDQVTSLDDIVENVDFVKYDYYLETARSFGGDSPRRRFGTGGIWPKGQKNIGVTATWGRAAVPEAIKRAVILLTLERLVPGSTKISPPDVASLSWSDHSVTFKGSGESNIHQTTGYSYIDRLLTPYINYSNMFIAVPEEKQTYDRPFILD